MTIIKTIGELKSYLTELVNQLGENFKDDEEIEIANNTYWLENQDSFIAVPDVGFIDLKNPTNTESCEWCETKFKRYELIHKGGWCLCENCYKYLESKNEL